MAVYYLHYAISTLLLLSPFSSSSFSVLHFPYRLHLSSSSSPLPIRPLAVSRQSHRFQQSPPSVAFNFHQGAFAVSHLLIPNHALSLARQSFMMMHFLFLHLFTSLLLHYGLLWWAIDNHTLSSSTFIINLISTVAFIFMIASFNMQQLSSLKNLASYLSIHSNFQSSIISSLSFISTFLNTILYIPIARRPRLLKREVL